MCRVAFRCGMTIVAVFGLVAANQALAADAAPSKEAAVQVLRDLAKALEANDDGAAAKLLYFPRGAKPEEIKKASSRFLKSKEVSSEGVEILVERGRWGRLDEVFPREQANRWLQKLEVPVGACFGLGLGNAEAGFYWTGQEFRVIRCDDIGKLAAASLAEDAGDNKRVALLVGVNRYDKRNFRNLEYAERDVEELAKVLGPAGYEVHLLTGSAQGEKRAELKNIQKAVEAVLTGRKKEDLVLVALAGHGLQIEVTGADGKPRAESFYCPADAERDNPATMLAIGKLFEDIDRRGGGQNLVLVDACREDPTRGRGLDGGRVTALPEGLAVLFGCRAGEKTFESKNASGGHGVLFHFVLEGLRGAAKNDEGEVTWDRLTEYVRRRVSRDAPMLIGDDTVKQSPNLIANLPGESPVLLWRRTGEPKLLSAPFDAAAARAAQHAWARYLGKPGFVEENSLGMKLTLIPPGEFLMGSDDAEAEQLVKEYPWIKREWFQGERQHRVRITQPYYLGTHEVTVGQFRQFVETAGYKTDAESSGQGGWGHNAGKAQFERHPRFSWKETGEPQSDRHPVINVSWNDAQAFCKWLSEKERRPYRLATEAEWEYACRAGTTSRYSSGSKEAVTEFGNVADASAKAALPTYGNWAYVKGNDGYVFTAPVGQFKPNPFGLHDMHGNVLEWCHDFLQADNHTLPTDDPRDDRPSPMRVLRGGGWFFDDQACRSAARSFFPPDQPNGQYGFRVVAN